jgi:hypothetical protein
MIAGGTVAAAGRFFPQLTGNRDPVLAGTAVNLVVLLLSILAARLAPARPGTAA